MGFVGVLVALVVNVEPVVVVAVVVVDGGGEGDGLSQMNGKPPQRIRPRVQNHWVD